jgi:phosphoglycerate dehydrogenase-like enzyme
MKALFLGTLAASQATPIIEFITADVSTEILDNNEPAQAAAALADADVLLTGVWRSGFPAAPKLRLLQVPLAGTDGIDVSSLPKGVTLCNAYGHEAALGEFAIMMMLAWGRARRRRRSGRRSHRALRRPPSGSRTTIPRETTSRCRTGGGGSTRNAWEREARNEMGQ